MTSTDLGTCTVHNAPLTGQTVDGAPDPSSAPEVILCTVCADDQLTALVEVSRRVNDWEAQQNRTCLDCNVPTVRNGVHERIGHAVVQQLPSAHEGHELSDATTNRARTVSSLRTVACTMCRTQYTADGLARAVELHDDAVRDHESSRERRELANKRNGLVLLSRYGLDGKREDAQRELDELDGVDTILPPTDDDDDTGYTDERVEEHRALQSAAAAAGVPVFQISEEDWSRNVAAARGVVAVPVVEELEEDAPRDYSCQTCGLEYGH